MRNSWLLSILLLFGCRTNIQTTFLSEVCIQPYKNYQYKTCHDIQFSINKAPFYIPKGFTTDLASIPRVAWPFMSPAHSSLMRPAIVHDWFYRMTCDFNRKEIDLIFYNMLLNDGITPFRAGLMYMSVRAFGRSSFRRDYCE